MHLDIEHTIHFSYDDYVSESWVELRMEPQNTRYQSVSSFVIAVGPKTKVFRYTDSVGNIIHHFTITEFHRDIEVRTRSIIETSPNDVFFGLLVEPSFSPAELGPLFDFVSFGGPIQKSQLLMQLFAELQLDSTLPLGIQVQQIGQFVHDQIKYQPNVTRYDSVIDHAIELRAGVCQDLAQIMLGLLRLANIPCRYVNGYLHVKNEKRETSESHAWVEVFTREHGWVGYDPTNALQPNEHYVVVATGRNYDDVPPNKGIYRGTASETMTARVKTNVTDKNALVAFRDYIGEIDLPVYAEMPVRTRPVAIDDQAKQTSQQQQQQ